MRTTTPVCPQCGNHAHANYIKSGRTWEKQGFWCVSCLMVVDPISRKPPIVRRMDITEYLSAAKERFDLILADPPWRYERATVPGNRAIENHYSTMPVSEIINLPVQRIAKDRSVLFLWSTAPMHDRAFEVMEKWGFTYTTEIVWTKKSGGKTQIGLGNNVRNAHEILLIGKRGDYPSPVYRPPSTFTAPRNEHSRKPAKSYEIVEAMYPDARRIELFARTVRRGWTGVGNEAVEERA